MKVAMLAALTVAKKELKMAIMSEVTMADWRVGH